MSSCKRCGDDMLGDGYTLPLHCVNALEEDWNGLGNYLDTLESDTLLTYRELISDFEKEYGKGEDE